MLSVSEFLHGSELNMMRIKEYRVGGDGSDGTCDCIGLVMGAVKLAGGRWNGDHGTNYTVRNKMKTFGAFSSIAELKEGELVFKMRKPGDKGYALPDRYANDKDKNDYYHVGIVRCIKPFVVEHCTDTPGGIKNDNSIGNWKYHGELDIIDYSTLHDFTDGKDDNNMSYDALVTATSGSSVNLRQEPNTKSRVLKTVPLNKEIKVLADIDNAWAKVNYNGTEGYMMRQFLVPFGVIDDWDENEGVDTEPHDPKDDDDKITITLSRELALDLLAAIDAAL